MRCPIGRSRVGRPLSKDSPVSGPIAASVMTPLPLPRRDPTPRPQPLRRLNRPPVTVERNGPADSNQPPLRRLRGHEAEERSVERVDPGRGEPDPPETEREDRVLGVAGIRRDVAAGADRGEVRLALELVVELAEERARGSAVPAILEPARPDLGVGLAVDPSLRSVALAPRRDLAEVAVVAKGEAAGGVVEGLGVGDA